jgi:hypothetical protein
MFKGKSNTTNTPTHHYGAYDVVFAGKGQTKWTKTNGWNTYRSLIKKQTLAYNKLSTKQSDFALHKIVKPILDLGGNFYKLGNLDPMAEKTILKKVTQALRDSKHRQFSRKMSERKLSPLSSIKTPPSITHGGKFKPQQLFNNKCSSDVINDTPPRSTLDINTPMIVNLNSPVRQHHNQHTLNTVMYDINHNQPIVDALELETEWNQPLSFEHESTNVNTMGRQQLSYFSMPSPRSNPSSNSSYSSNPCYGSNPKPNPSLCPNPHLVSTVCQTSISSLGQYSSPRLIEEINAMQNSFAADDILSYLDVIESEDESTLINNVSPDIFDYDEPLDFRTV